MISVARSKSSKKKLPAAASGNANSVSLQAQWAGPLPPPAALENFNRIVPGAAERIIAMAEAEQKHRHALESGAMFTQQEAVRLAARDSRMGMILGALIAFGGIAAALFSFLHGAPWMLSAAFLSLPLMIVAVELIRRKH